MASELPAHLRRLEAEFNSHHAGSCRRNAQPRDALFDRQGFERHAACGDEGVPSGQAAVPAAPCRHDLEIPRDDRLPRRDGAPAWPRSDRPHQPGRRQARDFADRLGLAAAHPGDEDRSAAAGARPRPLRRRVRRRAAGRGEEPRERAHLLAPLGRACVGPAQPAPGTLAALQHPPARGRIDARLSALELDRARRLGICAGRGHSGRAALFLQAPPGGRALGRAHHGRRRAAAARARRDSRKCGACASAPSAAIR